MRKEGLQSLAMFSRLAKFKILSEMWFRFVLSLHLLLSASPMSLARHFLRRHALALPDALALVAPQQTVWNAPLELSYRQLNQCVDVVKDRLTQQFRVGPGDLVFTDLPNVAEGMVLQLALQELGASVATAKNAEGAQKLIDAVGSSRCGARSIGESMLSAGEARSGSVALRSGRGVRRHRRVRLVLLAEWSGGIQGACSLLLPLARRLTRLR